MRSAGHARAPRRRHGTDEGRTVLRASLVITGIALAYKGRAPVLVIAGDVARDFIYRDGSQAFDLVGMFKPITKLALQVNKTERIPERLH